MTGLGMDLVKATEAAAWGASAWVGSGDKRMADKAATDAMRERLNSLPFKGVVVMGEGVKDGSFGLFPGEEVGALRGRDCQSYDLCVDPVEGTRPTVDGGPEAISVIGVAGGGAMRGSDHFYAMKLAYGPEIAGKVNIRLDHSLGLVVETAAAALGKPRHRLVVCVLDRPRHRQLISDLRGLGVRIKLIHDCDVSGAVATCLPGSGVDLMYGIGGAPESVISACAMKCLGGVIQVRFTDGDQGYLTHEGDRISRTEDLVSGECAFAATGITDGSLLRGVRSSQRGYTTQSVFMESGSGTVRWVTTEHGS